MSKTVYGRCPAGCKYQVVPKDEYVRDTTQLVWVKQNDELFNIQSSGSTNIDRNYFDGLLHIEATISNEDEENEVYHGVSFDGYVDSYNTDIGSIILMSHENISMFGGQVKLTFTPKISSVEVKATIGSTNVTLYYVTVYKLVHSDSNPTTSYALNGEY